MQLYHPFEAAATLTSRASRPATSILHDASDARVVLFRIDPGQEVAVHTSASTVILTVLSGSGTVLTADEPVAVQRGDIVAYEVREPHGMRAGDEQLLIAATIAPKPGTRSSAG